MNMVFWDWFFVLFLFGLIIAAAMISKRYTRTIAGFLAADRCAGRYIVSISEGIAALGAISIIATFQIHYAAGIAPVWWSFMMHPILALIPLTGWVVYRFRQTRAMTMAQFFEMRYSRKLRIFAGILAFCAGIVNFGIFPAVAADFFVYFCGFPELIKIGSFTIPSFVLVMIVLLSFALTCTFWGGQITILLADFMQGIFVNIVFIVIAIIIFKVISWSDMTSAMAMAPPNASMVNPFHTSKVKDFNIWFYLIGAFGAFYTYMSWQGTQGFNCCAISPHEAKMGRIWGTWRAAIQTVIWFVLPICAFTLMHHPKYLSEAENVTKILNTVHNHEIRSQLVTPLAMIQFLPKGLIGCFCAVILAAFFSSSSTALHSWGSIFIQDIVVPLRKKPLTEKQQLKILRLSIVCVAVFIFCFSLFFEQNQNITLHLAVTMAVYTGGSGAVIIGGLYWKRGTTAAAWGAMIVGAVFAVTGIVIKYINPDFFINGQVMWFIAMVISILVYTAISLFGKQTNFNMNPLFHNERCENVAKEYAGLRGVFYKLGLTSEFSTGDKILFFATYSWWMMWFIVFLAVTYYHFNYGTNDEFWFKFWFIYLMIYIATGIIGTVLMFIGGMFDIRKMFKLLKGSMDNREILEMKEQKDVLAVGTKKDKY
jgi:SSS family solute:Na+ symporter